MGPPMLGRPGMAGDGWPAPPPPEEPRGAPPPDEPRVGPPPDEPPDGPREAPTPGPGSFDACAAGETGAPPAGTQVTRRRTAGTGAVSSAARGHQVTTSGASGGSGASPSRLGSTSRIRRATSVALGRWSGSWIMHSVITGQICSG